MLQKYKMRSIYDRDILFLQITAELQATMYILQCTDINKYLLKLCENIRLKTTARTLMSRQQPE
jgi:hypothetical protein